MKKTKLFCVLPLAAMALTGCFLDDLFGKKDETKWDINPSFVSGTEEEKEAVLKAINKKMPCVTKSTNAIFPGTPMTLKEDDGEYIIVTTKQKMGSLTVDLEWTVDESQTSFKSFAVSDDNHKILNVNYPGFGNPDSSFVWTLAKATCGTAVTEGNKVADYSATLKGEENFHKVTTIADIYKVTDAEHTWTDTQGVVYKYPSTYDIIDYDKISPFYKKNEEQPDAKYTYLTVCGEVLYYAPDGNWALIADGDDVLELYAGSGTAIKPENFPALNAASKKVRVKGNLGTFRGNVQLGFITEIVECTAEEAATVTPATNPKALTESYIKTNLKLSNPYKCDRMAVEGFPNSMVSVTGTPDTSSILIFSGGSNKAPTAGTVDTITSGKGFKFTLNIGTTSLYVMYDYHTDKDGSLGIFNAIKTKLAAGSSFTITGTCRYNGDALENEFQMLVGDTSATGGWAVVPFKAAHIA